MLGKKRMKQTKKSKKQTTQKSKKMKLNLPSRRSPTHIVFLFLNYVPCVNVTHRCLCSLKQGCNCGNGKARTFKNYCDGRLERAHEGQRSSGLGAREEDGRNRDGGLQHVNHVKTSFLLCLSVWKQDERKAIEVQRKKKEEDEAVFKKAQELKERKKIELITALEEQSKIHHQRKIEEKKYMDEQVRVSC